ncbi:hypothetical protein KAR91_18645 [Candidatus Pacearchaeota archaeon]|nr:hypothetical protein [Candidatus Pacearchaeota archaeon]
MNIEMIQFYSGLLESIVKVAAVLVAGCWTYMLFIRRRQKFPRAIIKHKIEQFKLTNNKILVHLVVEIENKGDVLLALTGGEVRVLRIIPVSQEIKKGIKKGTVPLVEGYHEVDWPSIKRYQFDWIESIREIEPSEVDQYHYDFILDNDVETIQVYSHFDNRKKKKKDIGWNCTTFHNIS